MDSSGTRKKAVEEAIHGVGKLYSDNIQQHGLDPKSVGWRDLRTQKLRFDKLVQVIDAETLAGPITVNDYGCGYGAMFDYLAAMPGVSLERYYGYDISPEMLEACRQRIQDPRLELIQSTQISREADYSFVSGTYNVRLAAGDEEWLEYIRQSILELAAKSRCGFAFNLLSTYVDWKDAKLFYADPLNFFDFCKRNVSRYVSLLHDYPLYEWTLCVRKEK